MQSPDLDGAAVAAAAAFGVELRDGASARRWRERVEHGWRTDPDGAFVAVEGDRVVGISSAIVRDHLWCLSLLAVSPVAQSRSTGRALIERALGYREDVEPGLIISSSDPRALRLYGLSGFALRPTFDAEGRLDRMSVPERDLGIADVRIAELPELAEISRAVRGGAHTSELAFVASQGARILRLGDRGFVVVEEGRVWLLVARDEEAGTALLWRALELAGPDLTVRVRWISAEQQWAIAVVLAAGLRLIPSGAICVRGEPGPLRCYVPSAAFA
jgi:GNAT superfamily N-acetyltransferase